MASCYPRKRHARIHWKCCTSDPANAEMGLQLAMFAAQGYVVVMPDYHGYSG